jgi:hypothetical protein
MVSTKPATSPLTGDQGGGLDEALIERVIRRFWRQTCSDEVLGPISAVLAGKASAAMFAFWSSVTLASGTITVSRCKNMRCCPPMRHFDRWLVLFERCTQTCLRLWLTYLLKGAAYRHQFEMGRAPQRCYWRPRFVDHR